MEEFAELLFDPELEAILSQVNLPVTVSEDVPVSNSEVSTRSSSVSEPEKIRFAVPVTDEDVKTAQQSSLSKNTVKSTEWAVNLWKEWALSREKICSDPAEIPPFILLCSIEGLSLWVCKFILEIRRKDGQCYPPNTLYGIVCGLMRKLRNVDASIDFFKDARFSSIYKTLDGEMKRLRTLGVGVMRKQAEPITVAKEDIIIMYQGIVR